jgi:hypothetical protein
MRRKSDSDFDIESQRPHYYNDFNEQKLRADKWSQPFGYSSSMHPEHNENMELHNNELVRNNIYKFCKSKIIAAIMGLGS